MSETVEIPVGFSADMASVKEMSKQFSQQMKLAQAEAIKAGTLAGFTGSQIQQAVKGIADDFSSALEAGQKDTLDKIQKIRLDYEKKIGEATSAEQKKSLAKAREIQIKGIKDEFKTEQRLKSQLNKEEFAERKKNYDEINKELNAAAEQAGLGFFKNASKVGQTLKGIGGNIKSLNFQGIGQGVSDLIKQGGKLRQGRMRTQQKELLKQGKGAAAAKMGKAAMMVGKSAMLLGGVAVGLAAVVALLAKAFNHMQKMNKEILEQASVMEVASMAGGDLKKGLGEIRDVATQMQMVMRGIKSKEIIGLVGALGNANLTLKELTANAQTSEERTEKLADTIFMLNDVSKMLGVKMGDLATNMAKFAQEQGGNLESATSQFAALSKMALHSGFTQKYFYQTVLEATSGMALYNARVAETGNLLIQLGKVLGEDLAKSTVLELSKGFKSESTADSFKRVLKTGQKNTREIFAREAQVASQQFLNTIGEDGTKGLSDAFNALGMTVDLSGNAQENANAISKALGGLSGSQQEKMIGELINSGKVDRDSVRQISNLVELSKAAKGDAKAMAMAMDELGPSGSLLMQLKGLQGIVGNIPFHEMRDIEQQMLAEAQGYSREQVEKLKEISLQAHAQFGKLEELKQQGFVDQIEARRQVEQFGAYINENGQMVSARLDKTGKKIDKTTEREIKSAEELVALQMAFQESEIAPAMKESEYWGREAAVATVTLGDIMEGAILKVLETIAGYLVPIVSWVTGDLSKEEKQAKQEALGMVEAEQSKVRENDVMLKKQIRQQQKILATEKDAGKRQQATDMLAKLQEATARNDQIAKNLEKEKAGISGINYRDTNFGGGVFSSLREGESLGARKRLSSGQDFRDVVGGGGVDTGMTTGEMITAGLILGGIGVATGGTGPAALTTLSGATSVGLSGVGGGLAMDKLADMSDETKEGTKESKKQTDELEDINKTLQSTQAGSNFTETALGKKMDYSGGITDKALQKLGEEAKSKGTSKSDLREALESSGFSQNNIGKVMSGYGDGFSFWRNGKLTSQPIASQDDAVIAVGREGGALKNLLGGLGGRRGGGNTFNFYGGSTAEMVAHFENLQKQGVV